MSSECKLLFVTEKENVTPIKRWIKSLSTYALWRMT